MTTNSEGRGLTWLDPAVVVAAFLTSLLIRILPSASAILRSDYVRFTEVDAWYHMRLVDALVQHFPVPIAFDPYFVHGGSHAVPVAPLWDLLLYLPAWVMGLGSPSPRLIDVTAAFVPAICGALTCVIAWFIARDLWDRTAAFFATFVLALIPSQFLLRTTIGYSDHHAGEILFSTLFLALLFRLLVGSNDGSDQTRKHGALLVAFAGLSLALNLLVWSTALLTVVIVVTAIVIHSMVALGTNRKIDLLPRVVAALVVALSIMVPWIGFHSMRLSIAALIVGILVIAALAFVVRARERNMLSARASVLGFAAFALLGGASVTLALPDLVSILGELLVRLEPSPSSATIGEAFSLKNVGYRSLLVEYTAAALVAPVGFVLIGRDWWRRFDPRITVLLLWTLTMMGLTIAQVRFSYYLSVAVALLAGACGGRLFHWIVRGAAGRNTEKDRIYTIVAMVGISLVLIGPEVRPALILSGNPRGPEPAWHEGLTWLKDHSPEPFPPGSYTSRLTIDEVHEMNPSFRVLAWWDYGYWIMRIAHRVPVANPTQESAIHAARFYLSESPEEAGRILSELDAAWVITNHELLVLRYSEGQQLAKVFPAMAVWAGIPLETFYETWEYQTDKGDWVPIRVFYPSYFRTMAVRLQLQKGKDYVPDRSVWIGRWDDHRYEDGRAVKRLRSLDQYSTWDEARDVIDRVKDPQARIVSIDPFASCVPLEVVQDLEESWTSTDREVSIWRRRAKD